MILSLTRDLGVNLAGVEIILNMREKMDAMQREFERFFEYLKTHASEFSQQVQAFNQTDALIPISRFRRASIRRGPCRRSNKPSFSQSPIRQVTSGLPDCIFL